MLHDSKEIASTRLLELARSGDAASLEVLLSQYLGYMKVLLHAQLDPRLRARVSESDLIQETLLEAHRDFRNFAGSSTAQFTGWLRQILIHNVARAVETHLLAAKRDVRREQLMENLDRSWEQSQFRLAAMLADHRRSPASEAEHQEAMVQMARAIDSLTAEYREVIVLRHLEGLPFKAVAERMQRTPGAARMLWLRAI
ncbi:MAG: sigma-70 family RNA polymerase sigma factor, partial [Planctomycetales bacterium]|nr:sigma-70 family RNA polymerase sigma factor [Planctomycetales bacterium]